MTNKIMELADSYAVINRHSSDFTAMKYRARLEAEVQAHIDYTRAVINERDALRKVAQTALDVLENEGVTYWTDVQVALRKELGQ